MGVSLIGLFGTLALFHYTDLDMAIQRHFYDFTSGAWVWDRNEPITKWLLYDGVKIMLIVLAFSIFTLLAFDRHRPFLAFRRRPLIILLLSLLILPATVGALKSATNVPCPRDVVAFGGDLPHVDALERWPVSSAPAARQRCFPAGHASGGFALLALVLLGRSKRQKTVTALSVLLVGWFMGMYKTAIGDHFVSHTIVTMLLGILIISCLETFVPEMQST